MFLKLVLKKDQNDCFSRLFKYPPIESPLILINLAHKIKIKHLTVNNIGVGISDSDKKVPLIRNKESKNFLLISDRLNLLISKYTQYIEQVDLDEFKLILEELNEKNI